MNKEVVLKAYLNYLDKKISEMEKALESIYHGVDTAPSHSESHSDTTRSQQSRVGMEVSNRLSSLKKTRSMAVMISSKRAIFPGVGALITVKDDFGEEEYFLVVPGQGGESLFVDEVEVLSVSADAPILESISKTKVGDVFEFRSRRLTFADIS